MMLAAAGCLAPKRVGTDSGPLGPPPRAVPGGPVLVRIGMAEDQPSVRVTATGAWKLGPGAYSHETVTIPGGEVVEFVRRGDKVAAAGLGPDQLAPWLLAAAIDPADVMTWDGRRWRGEIHVIPTPGGSGLTVINVLELESYLAGVVPREIGGGRAERDLAAVAAQAVAARTYTVSRLGAQEARGFDLYADVRDQAYGGADWEDAVCTESLALTAGLVLRQGERLVPTYYHSTCGGHTASIDEIWPYDDDPVFRARPDHRPDGRPWCAESRYVTWEARWTWSELEAVIADFLPDYVDYVQAGGRQRWERDLFVPASEDADARQPGRLLDLKVRHRTTSGRVASLEIATTAGRYVVHGDRTRWVLRRAIDGQPLLRSSWFELEVDTGRSVLARGRGWGHGLGLCQMGAIGRSRAGQGFAEILAHYYPGSRLERLAGGGLP
jgi:stage II sporulation protein D